MMKKKLPSPSFIFSSVKYFEDLIFKSVLLYEKENPLISVLYFFRLKGICQKEIERLMMKNNKKEIFKYLDNIDSGGD